MYRKLINSYESTILICLACLTKKPPLPNGVGKNGMYYDPEHRNNL